MRAHSAPGCALGGRGGTGLAGWLCAGRQRSQPCCRRHGDVGAAMRRAAARRSKLRYRLRGRGSAAGQCARRHGGQCAHRCQRALQLGRARRVVRPASHVAQGRALPRTPSRASTGPERAAARCLRQRAALSKRCTPASSRARAAASTPRGPTGGAAGNQAPGHWFQFRVLIPPTQGVHPPISATVRQRRLTLRLAKFSC